MKSFVNIKHFNQDVKDIDIFYAKVKSVEKDIEITDKNDAAVTITKLTVESNGDVIYANLWGKWRAMSNYLKSGDTVNIIQAKSRDFSDTKTVNVLDKNALGYIVLEPTELIDATKMASVAIKKNHFCFLKYHLRRIKIEHVVNYYIIKGNLVGNIFDDFLVSGDDFDFDGAFENSIGQQKLKFAGIDSIPPTQNIKEEVRRDINNLTKWYGQSGFSDHNKFIEPNFISLKYGLTGRMDILFTGSETNEATIVELKTGRSPDEKGSVWIHHMFQLLAYSFMHDSVFEGAPHSDMIVYSGSNDIARAQRFHNNLKRDFIFLRNKIIHYEKGYRDFDYDTMLSFKRAESECRNCPSYLKRACDETFGIFSALDENQREYYFSLFRAVERERDESTGKNRLLYDSEDNDSNARTKYVINGLKFVDFSRADNIATFSLTENRSEIREGDSVVLHSGDPEHEQLFKGTVKKLTTSAVKVRLSNNYTYDFDAEKEWTLNRHDYLMSAKVMLDGLYKFAGSKKRFRDLIMLNTNPEFDSINIIESSHDDFTLNTAQDRAVTRSLCTRDYSLIQGPPGTGKTKTIAYIINELIKRKQRVILSALTNRAVDNVLMRLREDHGFTDFIRIGNESSVDSTLHENLLSEKVKGYDISEIKGLKKELKGCQLIATTTTSASLSFILDTIKFDAALIDEASQIPEPSIFSTITRARKFILVGDIHQLGPVTRSDYTIPEEDGRGSGVTGLEKTLFERLWEHNTARYDIEEDNNPCTVLDVQYRMHEQIARFSNEKFYGGIIKNADSVAHHTIKIKSSGTLPEALDPERPVIFIDAPTNGNENGSARENVDEAKCVTEMVSMLLDEGISGGQIGIIAPFKAQCALIRRMIEPYNADRSIIVDTVERFQGSERDVIITSFTVSDANGLNFLEENDTMNRKLNVTITRARKKLILIGNKAILSNDPIYAELIDSLK